MERAAPVGHDHSKRRGSATPGGADCKSVGRNSPRLSRTRRSDAHGHERAWPYAGHENGRLSDERNRRAPFLPPAEPGSREEISAGLRRSDVSAAEQQRQGDVRADEMASAKKSESHRGNIPVH